MIRRERSCHLVGWILFIICALLFIGSAVLSGDMLYLAGSIVFFVACGVFLIPLLSRDSKRDASARRDGRKLDLIRCQLRHLDHTDTRHNHDGRDEAHSYQPSPSTPEQEPGCEPAECDGKEQDEQRAAAQQRRHQ